MVKNAPALSKVSCIKTTEYSIHTRRCFITGEYCSQQTNIQKDRQKLHEKGEINAFVVMNFSSMSDVVYEARMKPFIEGLKKYLYLDKNGKRIACIPSGNLDDLKDKSLSDNEIQKRWKQVSHIHVHRADSNPVSNYIICNRICQQMQIADLIIVDVSVESANVFYEFGLATAFQKLILPICFSDSFYAEKLPKKLEELLRDDEFSHRKTTPHNFKCHGGFHNWNTLPQNLKHHIDCFPWRRKLYEHFGIRYADEDDYVSYLAFSEATDDRFGFSDTQYRKFPYRDKKEKDGDEVGEIIYCWLRYNYNLSETTPARYNTLVRYTMDGFLEGDQAGLCIVNFYNNIIRPMHEQYCFCGDRVAVLGQPNIIWDDPKDSKTGTSLPYSVSDLIRIGMDQATYAAERKRIKTNDYLDPQLPDTPDCKASDSSATTMEEIKKQVKKHIRNRTIPLYPDNPVYVTQYKDGIQKDLDSIFKNDHAAKNDPTFRCLYHIMLDTLRYANEVVVDLSSNSIQAMFWLGAAHGSDVYAVTVRHEMSEKEKSWSGADTIDHDRPIFDIAGLWTAMLRYGEMDSFYKQLELIQQGIDQHARLKLPLTDLELYEEEVYRQLHHAAPYLKYGAESPLASAKYVFFQPTASPSEQILVGYSLDEVMSNHRINKIQSALAQKSHAESQALESYYRDRFWRQLLRDNQLHLFLPLNDTRDEHGPRLQVIKWDMDTVSELSHYLSKRKVIGKYQFDTLRKNQYYGQPEDGGEDRGSKNARNENFISIGEQPRPIKSDDDPKVALTLADRINLNYMPEPVRVMSRHTESEMKNGAFHIKQTRGFGGLERQFYPPECIKCLSLFGETAQQGKNAKKECPLSSNSGKVPLLSTRFYLDKDQQIKVRLQCIGPQCANADRSPTDIPGLTTGSLELQKADNGEYTVTRINISANLDDKTLVSLLNILDLRFSPEQLSGDSVCLNIRDGIPGDSGSDAESSSGAGNEAVLCDMYAQLLLWRAEQTDVPNRSKESKAERTEYKYQVSLIGVSGPATKALTALLVDEEQKGRIWGIEGTDLQKDIQKNLKRYLPLNTLQTHIRKAFYDRLLGEIGNGDEFLEKAKKLALTYLSTILPQYFLPFLSKSDEKRIYNSLKAFLLTIDSKDDPVFERAVHNHADTILKALEHLLSNFRGVDALYNVEVSAKPNTQNPDTDNRSIKDIHLLSGAEQGEFKTINYLYINDNKETSNGKEACTPGDDPGSHHQNGR